MQISEIMAQPVITVLEDATLIDMTWAAGLTCSVSPSRLSMMSGSPATTGVEETAFHNSPCVRTLPV